MEIPTLSSAAVSAIAVSATFAAFDEVNKLSHVRSYDPRVTELTGFRHSVIRYRVTDKKETVSKPAKMVTVPNVTLPDEYSLLDDRAKKVILGVFEDEQDNMIRNMIDEKNVSYIGWDAVTLDKILDSLTAIRLSNRLTKEQIENWARIALKDATEKRAVQIAEAKGMNEADRNKQIAGTLNAYVELACKLAAPVPNIGQNSAIALKNLFAISNLADDMSTILTAKLDAILNPKVIENVDL